MSATAIHTPTGLFDRITPQTPQSQQRGGWITHIDLDDLGDGGTSGVQDSLDVVAADLGLLADVALDEVTGGVSGDLAGDEELAVGADGLGLWVGELRVSPVCNLAVCPARYVGMRIGLT